MTFSISYLLSELESKKDLYKENRNQVSFEKLENLIKFRKKKDMTSKKRLGSENRINQSSLRLRSGQFIGKSRIKNAKENIK